MVTINVSLFSLQMFNILAEVINVTIMFIYKYS